MPSALKCRIPEEVERRQVWLLVAQWKELEYEGRERQGEAGRGRAGRRKRKRAPRAQPSLAHPWGKSTGLCGPFPCVCVQVGEHLQGWSSGAQVGAEESVTPRGGHLQACLPRSGMGAESCASCVRRQKVSICEFAHGSLENKQYVPFLPFSWGRPWRAWQKAQGAAEQGKAGQ